MDEMRNACRILSEHLKGRDHLENIGIDGRIILKWILRKEDETAWTEFIWCRAGTSGEFL
jgi:hypothetical protein